MGSGCYWQWVLSGSGPRHCGGRQQYGRRRAGRSSATTPPPRPTRAASFYDLNAHLSYDLDARNFLCATGYVSRDHFRLASDTTVEYHNTAASLKWQHGSSLVPEVRPAL
ncbi:MAG: hypothetical protein WKG07_28660 [Hymenobacter sp.]